MAAPAVVSAPPAFLGTTPAELGVFLGGSGRAQAAWRLARAGRDPFRAGPAGPRRRLIAACTPTTARVSARRVAACGTTKLCVSLHDGAAVETVIVPSARRTTVCVSSQVGCGRACSFCVTATMGLVRSLSADEIVAQLYVALPHLDDGGLPRNVVYMGMGEPLDNFDAVRRSLAVLTDPRAFAVGPARITLSTIGPSVRAIRRAGILPGRLAWSLHSALASKRRVLVPRSHAPLPALRDAFAEVIAARREDLFVEMTLIAGVNDAAEDARAVAALLAPLRESVRVNLLPLNPGRPGLAPASDARAERYRHILRDAGYLCIIRKARGADAAAACGQLVTATPSRSVPSRSVPE